MLRDVAGVAVGLVGLALLCVSAFRLWFGDPVRHGPRWQGLLPMLALSCVLILAAALLAH